MSDVTQPLTEQDSPDAIATELDRIMRELDPGNRRLPVEAICAARAHRELIIPRLIAAIREATAAARKGDAPEGNAHFLALFLLIEFKAGEAFPAIVEAFSLPGELPCDLFGDAVHSAWSIAVALFAADRPDFIDGLVSDRALNKYVRWAAAQSYVHLVRDGRLTRDDAVERLRRLLRDATEQADTEIAGGLACVLLSFGPVEALDDLRQASTGKSSIPVWSTGTVWNAVLTNPPRRCSGRWTIALRQTSTPSRSCSIGRLFEKRRPSGPRHRRFMQFLSRRRW